MKQQKMTKPMIATTACMLGAIALPAAADSHAMDKRMEALEQELSALKQQMASSSSAKAGKSDALTFGGYIKVDARHVRGDLAYQDYWRGNAVAEVDGTKHTKFNVKETRLNAKYSKKGVTAFVEMDLYGTGGNEVVSNSVGPRLRHAFIKHDGWLVGQFWSNFMPLKSLPESLDFGGPIVAEAFIRQPQIRYTHGNFAVSLENPETWGDGDVDTNTTAAGAAGADSDEDTPDLTATYKFNGDWGEVQVGALARLVDPGEENELALAANLGARFNVGERDDIRVQINVGESGRYVGGGMFNDIVTDPDDGSRKLEETTAYMVAYRHFWSDDYRSTAYYGAAESDVLDQKRSHWGVNLIRQVTSNMSAGLEVGNYARDDSGSVDADSNYLQVSWKYVL